MTPLLRKRQNAPDVPLWMLVVAFCLLAAKAVAFSPIGPTSLHSRRLSIPHNARSLVVASQSQKEAGDEQEISSPLNDPALSTLDVVSLLGFAAIGKASHAPDGSIDFGAVVVTAFPFIAAWLATSPLTGVYSDLEIVDSDNKASLAKEVLIQTAKGWALAVPLGCALRGVIKGYVPPLPFVIVTLVATLVILSTVRVVYAIATMSQEE